MPQPPADPQHRLTPPAWMRRAGGVLFAAALLSMALVHQPETGWNVNTRLALVFAIVDQGTLSIDAYHDEGPLATGDKAIFQGRHYSDKIFGVSLLGLPVYAAMQWIGFLFDAEWPFQAKNYVLRLFAVSIPAALSVVLLWMLLVRAGAPPRRALATVAFAFYGSMWFGYSLIFMPYAPGICAVLAALHVILFPPAFRLTARNSLAAGLLLGFAMLCDLVFGLIVAAVGVVYLLRLVDQTGVMGMRAFAEMKGDRTPVRRGAGLLAAAALGGALPLLLFAAYSMAIFGKPTIPYEYEASELFRTEMARGFMGVRAPSAHALWFLTVHPLRGVLFWSPWIVAALAGAVLGVRSSGRRRLFGWLAMWAFAAYLAFNSGYYMWWGGWAMGPRLMLPMMAALPLAIGELLRRDRPPWCWWLVVALGAAAVALNWPLAFLDPQTRLGVQYPEMTALRAGDTVFVAQFEYLKAFYGLSWLTHPEVSGWWKASAFAGVLLPGGLLVLAARLCPAKHLPFERLELPFIQYNGATAPPPASRGMRSEESLGANPTSQAPNPKE